MFTLMLEGRIGAFRGQKGSPSPVRQGLDSEVVVGQAHAAYQEPTLQGQVYTISTALAGITVAAANVSPAAAGTGQPLVGVYNPPGSGKLLVIWKALVATVSGTPGGPFGWNVIKPSAGITAAGTVPTNNKTLDAAGSKAKGFVNQATTSSPAGAMFRVVGGPAAVAAGAGLYGVAEELDGDIVVPEGGFVGIYATAVGTTHVVAASMTWEEVDA